MVEQGIRRGICHSVYRYAKTNNSIYFPILLEDTSQFNEDLYQNCNEESNDGYLFEVDVEAELYHLHNDLRFLPEIMKIEKVENPVANFRDKNEYVIRIRNLKQAINNRLVLKKLHRLIKFNQNAKTKYFHEHRSKKKSKKF